MFNLWINQIVLLFRTVFRRFQFSLTLIPSDLYYSVHVLLVKSLEKYLYTMQLDWKPLVRVNSKTTNRSFSNLLCRCYFWRLYSFYYNNQKLKNYQSKNVKIHFFICKSPSLFLTRAKIQIQTNPTHWRRRIM